MPATWENIKKRAVIKLYAGDITDVQHHGGAIGLSLTNNDERHIKHDITQPMPLPDHSVDGYQAEDVLEHIEYDKLLGIINEIHRVLKPGATFRLSLPDYGCDILRERSVKDSFGNIIFDPMGGGSQETPGHLWFPCINNLRPLLEKTNFNNEGTIEYLHYWEMDNSYVTKPIDYSKGHVQRTPDFDPRVQNPYRPMSIVVDLTKMKVSGASKAIINTNQSETCSRQSVTDPVKISFVIIVLNGMPFIQYCIAALYDIAHQIIVVEGAVENCMFAANEDGSSKDGTAEFVKNYPDRENKIKFIQGKWPEKCEMQNKALEYVTGDYVWLVDSDEIYKKEDLASIKDMLERDRTITQVNFIPDNFWKGFDYILFSPLFFHQDYHFRRIFKFLPGATFTSHRPPTMIWPGSMEATENMHLVDGQVMRKMGIILYHYSYVLESQVLQKIELYRRYGWGKSWGVDLERWFKEFYVSWTPETSRSLEQNFPIWTGNKNSYSVPFSGDHPMAIQDFIDQNPGLCSKNTHSLVMTHVIEAIKEALYVFIMETNILALETGTIRSYEEKHESTRHIAQWIGNRGKLISVDNNAESIRISRDICHDADNVEWILSDSIAYLKGLKQEQFHFVLLDSINNADIIFDEFKLVAPRMIENGILMVDDAGIRSDKGGYDNTTARKGRKIWQFLCDCGAVYDLLETPFGHGTQLKIMFTAENRNRILNAICTSQPEAHSGIRMTGKAIATLQMEVIEAQARQLNRILQLEAEKDRLAAALRISETDRAARLEVIEAQGQKLGRIPQLEADKEYLIGKLKVSEADRAARLEVIHQQGRQLDDYRNKLTILKRQRIYKWMRRMGKWDWLEE